MNLKRIKDFVLLHFFASSQTQSYLEKERVRVYDRFSIFYLSIIRVHYIKKKVMIVL